MRKILIVLFAILEFMLSARLACAGDVAANTPPLPVNNPFYVWLGGSYQSIALPTYNLGFIGIDASIHNLGAVQTYSPRPTGSGVSGGIGYAFTNFTRFEIAGSYVKATSSAAGSTSISSNFADLYGIGGGFLVSGPPCLNPGSPCQFSSSLNTSYAAWQISAKVAADFKNGPATITPFLTIFGGHTHDDQSLSQELIDTVAFAGTGTYTANTVLGWTDFGAALGLHAGANIAPWVAVGAGGSVGVADRTVSLSGSDSASVFQYGAFTSSISTFGSTTPVLANAETDVTIRLWQGVALKTFVGLNYDSGVPGIVAPGPSSVAPFSTPTGITYQHETSYYTGGLLKVLF